MLPSSLSVSSLSVSSVKPAKPLATRLVTTIYRIWKQRFTAGVLTMGLVPMGLVLGGVNESAIASTEKPIIAANLAVTATTAQPDSLAASYPAARVKMTFDQLMNVGYAASRQGDFNTALINFRRALALRPRNAYAAAAADNMAYYIEHARITARQWEITQLETRLTNAINQKDWVCAATTLDELTMYTKPNSLNRARLVGQRGEVAGRLDARLDHEAWSTVCAAQRPVY